MTGTLYLLPNRISESAPEEELPEGTLTIARTCNYFLAENAKSARSYLKAIGHPKPISELKVVEIGHEPDLSKVSEWLKPVIDGSNASIVSESGSPCVADPGAAIVREAHAAGIRVVPLTGPCSILLTLMASGLNGQRFRFWGYLPIPTEGRAAAIRHLEKESRAGGETELFIETPYRNNKMLASLVENLKDSTLLTVAVDITGLEESIRTKKVSEWKKNHVELPKIPTVFAILS